MQGGTELPTTAPSTLKGCSWSPGEPRILENLSEKRSQASPGKQHECEREESCLRVTLCWWQSQVRNGRVSVSSQDSLLLTLASGIPGFIPS